MSTPEIVRVLMLSYGTAMGKSSLISRFIRNEFEDDYMPTTGDIHSKTMDIDGETVILQILDTPGEPRLSQIAVESMKFADAFMIVYDTSQSSLTSCLPLRFSVMQEKQMMNPPMVLVGTKTDLNRRTRKSSGYALGQTWGCPFFETSARDNVNVGTAFVQLVREHRARRRTFVHERKLSTFISNAFPKLRSWDSSQKYARVLKNGWIHKRGFLRQNWKSRYVVVYDDGSLQYFDGEDDVTPLGEFNLKDVWKIGNYRETGHEDAFVLHTPERDWYFSCVSSAEKESWLNIVTRFIAHFASNRTISEASGWDANESALIPSDSDLYFEKRLSMSSAPSNSSSTTTASSGMGMLSPRSSQLFMTPIGEAMSGTWT